MRDIRTVKKEKQRLFMILGDLYTEHKPLDNKHPAGKKTECETCQQIVKCSDVIAKLEKELVSLQAKKVKSEKKVLASLAYFEPTPKPPRRNSIKKKWSIYHVKTIEGKEYYYRVLTKAGLFKDFEAGEKSSLDLTLIPENEWGTTYLESGKNGVVSLLTISLKDMTGRVGEKNYSQIKSIKACTRKESEDFIYYDGENHDEINAFCEPFPAQRTKKGNKLQIVTKRGSFSIEPNTYLTKNILGRLDSYDKEEFELLYDIADKKVWISF